MVDYRLLQDELVVAFVSGTKESSLREINHYAAMYSQDGPVQIQVKTKRQWVDYDG